MYTIHECGLITIDNIIVQNNTVLEYSWIIKISIAIYTEFAINIYKIPKSKHFYSIFSYLILTPIRNKNNLKKL